METWTKTPKAPFGEAAERVLFDPDLLVSIVAQVRFAPVRGVREPGFVAPFQEVMQRSYPVVETETQPEIEIDADGVPRMANTVLWRFWDAERNWRTTLSENFVSLASSEHSDQEDFLSRVAEILDAVGEHIRPEHTNRVSVRYIDRPNEQEARARVSNFIRSELLGQASAELGDGIPVRSMMQAEFDIHDVHLLGRWGHMLPKASHDAPIDESDAPSWVLDLDAFAEETKPFDPAACAADTRRYAGVVQDIFRWAFADRPKSDAASQVRQLKDAADLTWDQIRRLFGVSRRAVHMWASGARMNSRNEERLTELLEIVSGLGASPEQRHEALMRSPTGTGRSLFQQLLLDKGSQQRIDVEALLGSTGAGDTIHGKFLFAEGISAGDAR